MEKFTTKLKFKDVIIITNTVVKKGLSGDLIKNA